jgi:phosphomannomutase
MSSTASPSVTNALVAVESAQVKGLITTAAVKNLQCWLTEDRYSGYRDEVIAHINDEKWQKLDDVFWTIIPFGTGGRRGRMYPIGSNAINDRTIGESAQGLADYVVETLGKDAELSCAIAYDTRHKSRHFAELCAGIMVAAGFKVYFIDDYRATPQLSFAVRYKKCSCGIMVTASHNPPSDNAVKVYWSSGAQVLPPHDEGIITRVLSCQEIRSVPFDKALADGHVEIVTGEIDEKYFDAAYACRFEGPRDIKILYTPLHGVGAAAVVPLMRRDGFDDLEIYGPQADPSPDFPNVPGHVSNPENTIIFADPIKYAQANGHELILATDPDADRLGCAAPITMDPAGPWRTFTGNQLGVLLADFVLSRRAAEGTLTPENFIIKTLVTTEMIRLVARNYGVDCESDLLVGFKYIAETMDRVGPDNFVFGTEESHGYLIGQYVRDKDGAVACMLMSELAAAVKASGKSLQDHLYGLYRKYGYHQETVINLAMEGSEGMAAMQRLMAAFRSRPMTSLAGIPVAKQRDYLDLTVRDIQAADPLSPSAVTNLTGPVGNLIIMDLVSAGNYVAVRPSGTEPKIKLYVFTRLSPEESVDIDAATQTLAARIEALEKDIRAFAKANA